MSGYNLSELAWKYVDPAATNLSNMDVFAQLLSHGLRGSPSSLLGRNLIFGSTLELRIMDFLQCFLGNMLLQSPPSPTKVEYDDLDGQ